MQMRVSGCKNHYKFVLGTVAKAKTMTNNLHILSVLAAEHYLLFHLHLVKDLSYFTQPILLFPNVFFSGKEISKPKCLSFARS